jgi:hypothetical protein
MGGALDSNCVNKQLLLKTDRGETKLVWHDVPLRLNPQQPHPVFPFSAQMSVSLWMSAGCRSMCVVLFLKRLTALGQVSCERGKGKLRTHSNTRLPVAVRCSEKKKKETDPTQTDRHAHSTAHTESMSTADLHPYPNKWGRECVVRVTQPNNSPRKCRGVDTVRMTDS